MALGGTVWTLDWVTFHHSYDVRDTQGVQWILMEEKGFWGSPGTGATLSPRLNKHGAYRSPGWKKERIVTVTGRCYAESYAVLRAAEANVLALLSDPKRPGMLTCYSELGGLELTVFLDDAILCAPLNIVSEPGVEFSIQMVAPDPRKYSVEAHSQTTGLPIGGVDGLDFLTGDGLDFVTTGGLHFGSATPGIMMLVNSGTAPTMPVYTLTGPLTNPVLTAATGTMKYNGTLGPGDFLVIDPSAPSVLLSGTATRRHLLYPANFEAFAIPAAVNGVPGTLPVGLSHEGPITDLGTVTAVYKNAWF